MIRIFVNTINTHFQQFSRYITTVSVYVISRPSVFTLYHDRQCSRYITTVSVYVIARPSMFTLYHDRQCLRYITTVSVYVISRPSVFTLYHDRQCFTLYYDCQCFTSSHFTFSIVKLFLIIHSILLTLFYVVCERCNVRIFILL